MLLSLGTVRCTTIRISKSGSQTGYVTHDVARLFGYAYTPLYICIRIHTGHDKNPKPSHLARQKLDKGHATR
jgi:hypothetical protein